MIMIYHPRSHSLTCVVQMLANEVIPQTSATFPRPIHPCRASVICQTGLQKPSMKKWYPKAKRTMMPSKTPSP